VSTALLLSLALAAGQAAPDAAPAAAPEPASLVLIVASNRGSRPGRAPLQYADDDGAKYYEVFSSIAGEADTFLLTDFDRDTARLFPALLDKVRSPTRPQLDLVASKLARRSAELRRAGRAVRFHFVFAGHGDVDGGRGFLELADGPFTADDLQQLVRAVGATESHVILDSCNSFFVVNPRKPGGARFPTPRDAAEALARRLPNVGIFLSTSAQAEVYEWSELQSGVFSHAVRSGLLGAADANRDGRVSYEELAAFVETAVAAIKNPNFRPKVFARGPNGEDERSILDLPPARTALVVDDPGSVRLAVRDVDGLRWLDAYTEPGSVLRLWFPASMEGRLEVDRLSVRRHGVEVEASYRLPSDPGAPSRLAALEPRATLVAMRGPGEIFQALFTRPYGPAALSAYQDEKVAHQEAVLRLEPAPKVLPADPPETCRDAGQPVSEPGSRLYAMLRVGGVIPSLSSTGRLLATADGSLSPGASLAVGAELNAYLAAEGEVGYQHLATTSDFFSYPNPASPYTPVTGTAVDLSMIPLSANVRVRLPSIRPSPYLVVGGGASWVRLVLDPPDFNATLRASRFVPFLQAGAGVEVNLSTRIFLGLEARYVYLSPVRAFDSDLRLSGLGANAVLGVRR
jgi:hypothetical protein